MKLNKKIIISFLIFSFFIILIPIGVKAINWQSREKIYINSDDTVDGNFYFRANELKVEGNINGDLIGIANNVEITGKIEGDIIILSSNFDFYGEVIGSLRILANKVNIDGHIGKNLNILAVNTVINKSSKILWDSLIMSVNTDFWGDVKGGFYGIFNNLNIDGVINRNANVIIRDDRNNPGSLLINDNALISGNLYYKSNNEALISNEAIILGEIETRKKAAQPISQSIWKFIFSIFSALLIALVLIHLFKNQLREICKKTEKKPIKVFLWGLFIVFILPIILIILALTLIGFKLAILLTTLYISLLLLSKVISAIIIGRIIVNNLIKKPKTKYIWKAGLGIIIVSILSIIPVISYIFSFLFIIFGTGAIFNYLVLKIKS